LEERIEALVRQVTGFRMKFEQIVALPARLTANLLNYVDFLGYDALAPGTTADAAAGERPTPGVSRREPVPRGGPQLGEQQSTYDQDYYTDWIRAFLDLVERNARNRAGRDIDLAANQRLGDLLTRLRSAA
jgi:hypothetical protein